MRKEIVFNDYYNLKMSKIESEISMWCRDNKDCNSRFSEKMKIMITQQLQMITLRTYLLEMKVCENGKELIGQNEEERYMDYVERFLTDESYLSELLTLYPHMEECLNRYMKSLVKNVCEMILRFENDKALLNEVYFEGTPCSKIKVIDTGGSDLHNGNQMVYILTLDNDRKIVYKPRNMKVDEVFGNFVNWVSKGVGIEYWWNKNCNRNTYGWSEWVRYQGCETLEQVENYYFREGMLLAICYILGATDIHYENLIACGEYPVIVDLEMGIGNGGILEKIQTESEVTKIYQESVLHTGILPVTMMDIDGNGIDVSAIRGMRKKCYSPMALPVIVDAGRTDMDIQYRRSVIEKGKNLVKLKGKFIDPDQFAKQLRSGFERTYRFLMNHKDDMWDRIRTLENAPVRYLVRDTRQYVMMLLASYYPEHMEDSAIRKKILYDNMIRGINANEIEKLWEVEQEVKDLTWGIFRISFIIWMIPNCIVETVQHI